MAWRPHSFARTNPNSPSCWGVCERCGMLYNLVDLVWQYQWRGDILTDIRRRVCTRTCLDQPSDFLKPIILPADPEPVDQPRPEPYAIDENAGAAPPSNLTGFEVDGDF